LSTEEPIDSLSMGDEHLDTIPATGSDEVIKSSIEDLVPILSEFEDNPTPYFEILTKSPSTSPKSFLEETNTFHNSLPEFENFYFDLGEEFVDELTHIISPPEYDRFYFRDLPDPGELMYVLNSGIREKLSTTSVNLPIEDD
nr:hypothetical protein [Tanacetum cinerariifolium]